MDFSMALVTASAAIGSQIIYSYLRGMGKKNHYKSQIEKDYETLKKEYFRWNQFSFLLAIPSLIVVIIGFWFTGPFLVQLRDMNLEPSKYLVNELDDGIYLVFFFMAIVLSISLVYFLYFILLGKKRFIEFWDYTNQKFGYNINRTFIRFTLLVVSVGIIIIVLFLKSYVRVTETSISVNEFFSLSEKDYKYGDIEMIEFSKSRITPIGNISYRQYYIIKFKDGNNLSLASRDSKEWLEEQKKIVEYINREGKIPVTVSNPYPEK